MTAEGLHIYTPSAPKKGSGGGKYRRPVNVWVIMAPGPPSNIRCPDIRAKVNVAWNVDGRYSGPRSAYGQALAEADEIALNIYNFITKGIGYPAGSDEFRKTLQIYLREILGVDRRFKKYKLVMAEVAARRMQS